jgi:hypothetical protein
MQIAVVAPSPIAAKGKELATPRHKTVERAG